MLSKLRYPDGWAPALWIPIIILAVLLLGGCTAGSKAALQDGADTAAQTLIVAPCAMTVGAYKRLDDVLQKTGVDFLCPSRLDPPSAP